MTHAPIDVAAIRRCTAPFTEARTLPAAAYTSEELLQWEVTNFFEPVWVCVGRSEDLPAPGDQRAVAVGREGVLLTRAAGVTPSAAGELRAFSNTCRHRGHELLPCGAAAVNRSVVQCPYHRWTYALDGSFRGGPGLASQPGFDKTDPEHGLLPMRVREWHGWTFVDVTGRAVPFERHVGNLSEIMAPYEGERLRVAESHSYEVAANWKVVVENYHECYHCSEIHPELCRVSPPQSGEALQPTGLWVGGTMDLRDGVETMSLSGLSDGVRIRGVDDATARTVGYFMLWPNLLLSPHPDYVMTHRIEPLAPNRTFVECQWLFPPEATESPGFDPSYAADFWDITNRQDWSACESVQRGVGGSGYRQAPFSDQEDQVHEFDLMVAQGYLTGSVTEPVPHVEEVRR